MTEWWTYRPSDFLLFSSKTYYRLFELYNRAMWPAHLLALIAGCFILVLLARSRGARASGVIDGVAWLWVAWAFFFQRYASINWAANWFAVAFAIEGVLLIVIPAQPRKSWTGFAVFAFALFVEPLIGVIAGRTWWQIEMFGMTPDPTAVATIGLLLARRSRGRAALFVIPILWCVISALTLCVLRSK